MRSLFRSFITHFLRPRFVFFATLLILFLFDLGFVVYEGITYQTATTRTPATPTANASPAPTATTGASPTASATAAGSPTPEVTATPTFSQRITADEHSMFDPFVAVLAFDAAIVITVLVVFLLIRAGYLSGLPNFVVSDFSNATGDDRLDKVLTGLNQLTRERLVDVLKKTSETIQKYGKQNTSEHRYTTLDTKFAINLKQFPVPTKRTDARLNTLLTSLQSVTSGEINTVIQLLMNLVFTPRGTRVTPTLQSKADTPATLGISWEITDLQGDRQPKLYTIWEQVAIHTGVITSPRIGWSLPAAPSISQQQARAYFDAGRQLDALGLYGEAISHFEEALKRDKEFKEAAEALAASVSRSQVQQSALSAFTGGKELQNTGLLSQAIESYKKPLPPEDQSEAEKYWKAILKLTNENEAIAYFNLAEFYKKDGVYLYDQSLDLYKTAVARGSQEAAKALEKFQRMRADQHTAVGQILYGLTQYDTAEKYLKAALEEIPGDPKAQAALADVKQSKLPIENKDALACYALGQLYEERGALDNARSQYENALTKQPDFEKAKDSLKRVLQARKTSEERYLELIEPAARWLAIEITQQAMEAVSPDKLYRAQVYNFIGSYHQSSAQAFKNYSFFYNLAIDDFKRAMSHAESFFQPCENLADTYVMIALAVMVQSLPRKDAQKEVHEDSKKLIAAKSLQPSFTVRIETRGFMTPKLPGHKLIGEIIPRGDSSNDKMVGPMTPSLSDIQDSITENLYEALTYYRTLIEKEHQWEPKIDSTSRKLIQVGECTAQLMTGDVQLIRKAQDKIKEIQAEIIVSRNSRLLYNLSCWYGIAHCLHETLDTSSPPKFDIKDALDPTQSALQAALRYVTYSLALDTDHDLWNWAPEDPSFACVTDESGWRRLNSVLTKKLYEISEWHRLKDVEFKNAIDQVLTEAGWLKR